MDTTISINLLQRPFGLFHLSNRLIFLLYHCFFLGIIFLTIVVRQTICSLRRNYLFIASSPPGHQYHTECRTKSSLQLPKTRRSPSVFSSVKLQFSDIIFSLTRKMAPSKQ